MLVITRRNALKIVGPGAALLTPMIRSMRAEAQGTPANRKLITWFTSNGVVTSAWNYGGILKALMPFQANIQIHTGLNMQRRGGGHQGPGCLLTGTLNTAEAGLNTHTNASYDVIAGNGTTNAFKSLQLAAPDARKDMFLGKSSYKNISAAAAGQAIIPELDPQKAFDRVFGNVVLPTAMPGGTKPDPEMEAIRAQRRSVLDYVRTNLNNLQTRLGAREKMKIDAHLSALRELEMSLSGTAVMASGACSLPGKPGTIDPYQNASFQMVMKSMTEIGVQALACGLTRVVTFTWEGGQGRVQFTWAGVTTDHHEASHGDKTTPINTWYNEQMAAMLTKLQSIQDTGGTLFDNTMVLYCNDIAVGSHSASNMPFYVAAGKNTGVKVGATTAHGGKSHNILLSGLIQQMGVDYKGWTPPSVDGGAKDGVFSLA